MDIKILNRGFNYLSCKMIFSECSVGTSKTFSINKDVMFQMRYIYYKDSYKSKKDLLFINFSQPRMWTVSHTNKSEIISVRLQSKFFGLNRKYTVDEREWHLIYDNYCYHNDKDDLDLTIEIEPSFEKPLSFAPLYEDTALTDFELRGDDGSVQIHGAALAATSPALRRMLEGNWKETEERALQIPKTSKATLQHLKDYIYLRVLPETGLENLLLLASCYMMDDLQEQCTTKLVKTLKADNAIALTKFALDHNFAKLHFNILEYFQRGLIGVLDLVPKEPISEHDDETDDVKIEVKN